MKRTAILMRSVGALVLLTVFLLQPRLIPVAAQTDKDENIPESDLIHYGDLIDVDVVGSLEYDWRGTIDPEGFLQGLVLANEPVYALCKSEVQLAAELTSQYSKTLREPRIVVKIIDRSGRAAAVLLGGVKNQQRFRLKRAAKLSEVLALSGGITDTASGEVSIFRPADLNCFALAAGKPGTSQILRIKISDLLAGKPEANPEILGGDIISVLEALPIYVIGGVNTPRQISSREEISVTRAVASAGGLSKDGLESQVTIYRREGTSGRSISVDLKKVRSRQQEDVLLKPFDIVEVGQKGRPRSKFPPLVNDDARTRDIYKLPVRVIE